MSSTIQIHLRPLEASDKKQFILDNQEAFNYGALQENPSIDHHFEEDEQIISRQTIEESIAKGQPYRIVQDGTVMGGLEKPSESFIRLVARTSRMMAATR